MSADVRISIKGVELITTDQDKPVRTKRGKAKSMAKLVSLFEDSE